MDAVSLDVQLLAAALWQRAPERVTVSTERAARGYAAGHRHVATARSPGRANTTTSDPEHATRELSAGAASDELALHALRWRLLGLLAGAAASLTETAGRYDAMAAQCRARAHDVAALVAATRRRIADEAEALRQMEGPCS